jgi:hypothetical protein
MRRLTPSKLKDLLSGAYLTAGFALISSGVGIICGLGTGLIAGGIGFVAFQQWWAKSGG